MEANLLNCTLWNYTPDNSNARGDQWNDEDFSIFSRDQQTDARDIDSGGRALAAVVRPYPKATAGQPVRLSFDLRRRIFELAFRHEPGVSAPTEVFVPRLQYPDGCRVEVSDGTYRLHPDEQTLVYQHDPGRPEHVIRIRPAPEEGPRAPLGAASKLPGHARRLAAWLLHVLAGPLAAVSAVAFLHGQRATAVTRTQHHNVIQCVVR
jgi:hypothetical protein